MKLVLLRIEESDEDILGKFMLFSGGDIVFECRTVEAIAKAPLSGTYTLAMSTDLNIKASNKTTNIIITTPETRRTSDLNYIYVVRKGICRDVAMGLNCAICKSILDCLTASLDVISEHSLTIYDLYKE